MGEQLLFDLSPTSRKTYDANDLAQYLNENRRWNKVNFYSINEVATLLCLTVSEVKDRINYFYIDAIRVEGTIRIPYNALLRYIKDRDVEINRRRSYYDWVRSRGG